MTNAQRIDSYLRAGAYRRVSWWNEIHGNDVCTSTYGIHGHGYPVTPRQRRRLLKHAKGTPAHDLNRRSEQLRRAAWPA